MKYKVGYIFQYIVVLALLSTPIPIFGVPQYSIYFFNPESNVDNFALLKKNIDYYLAKQGSFQFRPFDEKKIFEREIQGINHGVFLISSWHYSILSKSQSLEAILVGTLNQKTTQTKVLSVKGNIKNIDHLKGYRIASAGSEEYTRHLLSTMLPTKDRKLLNSFEILTVPRDIDALISVSFGVAKAAITTENSISMLSSINPTLAKRLNIVLRGSETLLPIVAIPKQKNSKKDKQLVEIIEHMQNTQEGKKQLRMIGLDGWKRLSHIEKELLHGK